MYLASDIRNFKKYCSTVTFSFQIMILKTYNESKYCFNCKHLLFCYSPVKVAKINFGFNSAVLAR